MLYGIGIQSAAACSYMVVREICDNEAEFVALMNQKAEALGLKNTVFDNAVGFDSAGNLTTAEDMAVIMAYAMQSELIADILAPRTDRYGIKAHYIDDTGAEATYNVWFESSFQSRQKHYKSFKLTTTRLDATKTGYTNESFIVCMATSKQTGKQYVLVLGNKETDYTSLSEKFKATMMDIEYLYNQYVK
jgi:D-alanyl-D-alanine carboxypeptidase (penicillin-binding protein 5/6)